MCSHVPASTFNNCLKSSAAFFIAIFLIIKVYRNRFVCFQCLICNMSTIDTILSLPSSPTHWICLLWWCWIQLHKGAIERIYSLFDMVLWWCWIHIHKGAIERIYSLFDMVLWWLHNSMWLWKGWNMSRCGLTRLLTSLWFGLRFKHAVFLYLVASLVIMMSSALTELNWMKFIVHTLCILFATA